MPEALKEMFDAARFAQLAGLFADAHAGFDRRRFLRIATEGLAGLSLLQRMRRGTDALRATLPDDFPAAVAVLREVAPRIGHTFVGMLLPDYVGRHGLEHPRLSLDTLHYLTRFSSGEFAIREFLKRDLHGTLDVMLRWSLDDNEHVRRLSSEGCRPRLPWSFRLDALVADPSPALPILGNLREDPSLYVRKSVANHLNDISRDHPDLLAGHLAAWDTASPRTAWIVRRALRTLIKQGHPEALALVGAGGPARVEVTRFTVSPRRLRLGGTVCIRAALRSTARSSQNPVVDYAVHYVKASGRTSRKVFKLRQLLLPPGGEIVLSRRQRIADFTTRRHHAGLHRVELLVNGRPVAADAFRLER